jgi:ABC-type ATPase involved in cell division
MLSLSCTRSGVTLRELMATHDLDLVRDTGLRTLELNKGRLVYDSGADGQEGTR